MRRRVFVAESALRDRSLERGGGLNSLVGELGADLEIGWTETPLVETILGKSRELVLLGSCKNLGTGKELGGGEFEYVGPAHRSENERLPSKKPSLEYFSLLTDLARIGIGLLFGTGLKQPGSVDRGLAGVFGDGGVCLITGILAALRGNGRVPSAA